MGISKSEIIPKKVFIVSFCFSLSIFYVMSIMIRKKITDLNREKVVNGILFGLALLTAAARMMIRFRFQKNLRSDDYVLLFAGLCLIASQVLFYILKIDNIYWFAAVMFESSLQTTPVWKFEEDDPEAMYSRISMFQRMEISMGILTWTCIFAVKICFLLFFHQMITTPPLRKLIVAWRVIFGITIIFWAFCCCAFFMSCSHFGEAICKFQFCLSFTQMMLFIYRLKAPNQAA